MPLINTYMTESDAISSNGAQRLRAGINVISLKCLQSLHPQGPLVQVIPPPRQQTHY